MKRVPLKKTAFKNVWMIYLSEATLNVVILLIFMTRFSSFNSLFNEMTAGYISGLFGPSVLKLTQVNAGPKVDLRAGTLQQHDLR